VHAFGIRQNLIVPEANYPIPLALQKFRPRDFPLGIQIMLPTVRFDNQPSPMADEVDDIGADRHLPSELEAIDLAHKRPQSLFCVA
jgi:hypothetical protein